MNAATAISALVSTASLLFSGATLAKEPVIVNFSRSVDESSAMVALMTAKEYEELQKSGLKGRPLRSKLKSRVTRSIEVKEENTDGTVSSIVADLSTFKDGDSVVLCAIGPELPSETLLFVSFWTRTTMGSGGNYTDFGKIFPKNEVAKKISSDELFCFGQGGSGLRVLAKADKAGKNEEVYAHFTLKESDQIASEDAVVLGKSSAKNSRNAPGQFWPAISVFNVTK